MGWFWVLGWSGQNFSRIFRIFFENGDLQNLYAHAVFRNGRALKNHQQIPPEIGEKSMQILNVKKKAPKWLQNWIWEGLGLRLGGIWDSLGGLLGTFGRFFAQAAPNQATLNDL